MAIKNHSDQAQAAIFQEKTVPRDTRLAGWAALVETFHIQVPFGIRPQYRSSTSREAAVPRGSGPSSTSGTGPANP